jgi:glycine/D-amino acid oxidase-like deaminating enzyme
MTKYGRSPWIDNFPKSRVPAYAQQRGAAQTSVVIVGGGLTGCATAYSFAAAGVKVLLVEAKQIGRGTTGFAAGVISGEPGPSFAEVEKASGRRAARDAFQSWRRAALDFSALLRRLGVKCDLQRQSGAMIAVTPDQAARVKRDQELRRTAGLNAPLLNARTLAGELGLEAAVAIRDKDVFVLDPYRACVGLAAAAKERGAQLFERTVVKKITFGRKTVDVITDGGSIRADRVVVATGIPTALSASLARHFWFRTKYLALTEPVPAKIRNQLGRRATVVRDSAEPPHVIRWVDASRLLITGADAESSPARLRDRTLVQRTGQLMYELSTMYPDISGVLPAYGWDAEYARSGDGLPYFGPHRNFPRHLFAFGDSSHTVTGAYLASRVLLRYHLEEVESADEPFAFTRNER